MGTFTAENPFESVLYAQALLIPGLNVQTQLEVIVTGTDAMRIRTSATRC